MIPPLAKANHYYYILALVCGPHILNAALSDSLSPHLVLIRAMIHKTLKSLFRKLCVNNLINPLMGTFY